MDEPTRYPHLTQKGGAWLVTQLDTWRSVKNVLLPLRIPKLELDDKILVKFNHEYELFRSYPDDHIEFPTSVSMRSPYSNTQPIYTIHSPRALLSIWFSFSYHNWLKFSLGGSLGKMCQAGSCINPRHYEFGKRKGRLTPLSLDLPDADIVIPKSDADWIDLEEAVDNLVAEARANEDPPDKIITTVITLVADRWPADKPIPPNAGWSSVREMVSYKVKPTGETPKAKSLTRTTTEEILSWLDRKEK